MPKKHPKAQGDDYNDDSWGTPTTRKNRRNHQEMAGAYHQYVEV